MSVKDKARALVLGILAKARTPARDKAGWKQVRLNVPRRAAKSLRRRSRFFVKI
jgi:hypothetical protein